MKHLLSAFVLMAYGLAHAVPYLHGVTDKDPLSYAVGNWGWVLDQGATMIQSDYAAELIVYLMQKGRRNF